MEIVTIYTGSSCTSSRKAVIFFKENGIPYREIKLGKQTISQVHLRQALENSENGFEDLMKRTTLEEIMDKTSKECEEFLIANPRKMRCPLTFQGVKSYIGFNEDDFGLFKGKDARKKELEEIREILEAI
jgi:regulatory protein spx